MSDPDEFVEVKLTDEERFVLERGLVEWGGPAHCTEAMAQAMGFDSVAGLFADGARIRSDLKARRPLTRRDWTRTLLATEVAFASDVLGPGVEWPTTTGLDDVETLHALRRLQRKLVGVVVRRGAWA